jgi:acetyl esterase/lipase
MTPRITARGSRVGAALASLAVIGLESRRAAAIALVGLPLLAIALIPGSASAGSGATSAGSELCSDSRDKARRLDLKIQGEQTFGYFALPDRTPKGLVVLAHGRTASAITERPMLRQIALADDVVAVAMNYRHQPTNLDKSSPDYGSSTGWRVIEGAEDSVAAARHMIRRCKRLRRRTVVMSGISMGGQAAGLAVSSRAKRRGGKSLFDYWFDIVGVADIVQHYMIGRVLGYPIVAEIEQDFGGTYEERPSFYERLAIVNRAADIKESGLKGVVIVHATDDLTVLYDQSSRMYDRLREVGVPAQLFTVQPAGAPVGHTGYAVIKTYLDRLASVFMDRDRPRCFREFTVDGTSAAITPDPATVPC